MFIGYFNKATAITFLSVIFSVIGMSLLMLSLDNMKYAIICLMCAGICDLFDGAVARKNKSSEQEKKFGIQIDSLADTISFVIYPVFIFMSFCGINVINVLVSVAYALCGITRLAYFNTLASTKSPTKVYLGLPVSFIALILPLFYLLSLVITPEVLKIMYQILMVTVALCFILKMKISKPKGFAYVLFSILFLSITIIYLIAL